jgi:ubiquinone/menaquinone biosynthesis C-methylase UbiE
VVVLGAGVSALLIDLVEHGYRNLDAVDISQAALDQLRARLGKRQSAVRYICADVREVRFDDPVDVWHDRATFHFLTAVSDRRAYAARLSEAVVVGGHAVVATFSETGPEQCSGLPVARYSATSLHAEFAECFDMVESWAFDHITPWGAAQSFTQVLLQRVDRRR